MSYIFFLCRLPSSSLCTVFDSISSNINEVLSINLSANVFVFGDFNVHHKEWLTFSGGTHRPGELCYNFSISDDVTQMGNVPTRIPDCDFQSPALLDLFPSSDASTCSTMAFPPLGNSHHVVSVSTDFPLYSQWDAPFHGIAGGYSRSDWDGLRHHLRDVSWDYGWIFRGFRLELLYISLIVSIRLSFAHLHGLQLLVLLVAKSASEKIGALIRSMKFLSPVVALYLYKSAIRPCVEYCCHVWVGVPTCYLQLIDKLQKRICTTVGPSHATSLKPLSHRGNVASLSLFYRYYFCRCSSELAQLVSLPFS